MNIAYIYAGSWEFAYPQVNDDFDRRVWCDSDDFIFKYPRSVMPYGMKPTFYYFSQSARSVETFTHRYGFPMRRIPVRKGELNREWSLRMFREIDAGGHDLLHFYNYYRTRLTPDFFDAFALYCRIRRIPFVTHYQVGEFPRVYHGGPLKRIAIQPRRLMKAWALRSASRIFSLNRLEIESLTNPDHPSFYGLGFDKSRCLYVPNIVDRDRFRPMDKAEARAKIGTNAGGPIVLYVGFLRRDKGVQHLIRLMPRLALRYPGIRLWIAGNGEFESELRILAETAGANERVVFAGPVENRGLPPYYNAADVHVLPSYHESFGTVLIEAMACGTPSIGSAVGGIPEVLSGGAGLITPPRDEDALFTALTAVLEGAFRPVPETVRRKLSEYSYESAGSILAAAYENVLRRPRERIAS